MRIDLKFPGFCGEAILKGEPIVRLDPVAEAELKTEQGFTLALSESLARLYEAVGEEPFYLRLYEFPNHKNKPAWEMMATNQEYARRGTIFQSVSEKHLFTTSLHQNYIGLSLKDPIDNYCGSIGIELMMFGWKDAADGHWSADARAENLTFLSLIAYQRGIAKHYPKWTTHYIDAPTIKSWQIKALEL